MNIQDVADLESWIGMMLERSFSSEESVLALYLFSETIKMEKVLTKEGNRSFFIEKLQDTTYRELYKTIAAASVVLSTKIMGDGEYFTICEMECTRPPFPPFLDSIAIVKAEKIILEIFNYNLVGVVNKCFNVEHRMGVHKQILARG